MGRRSQATELLRQTGASRTARERVRVMLLTLAGTWSVKEGLERLHLSRTRFQQLRSRMLSEAVWALEFGEPGRPRREDAPESAATEALRAEVARLERELRRVHTSLEIAQSEAGEAVRRRLLAKARGHRWRAR